MWIAAFFPGYLIRQVVQLRGEHCGPSASFLRRKFNVRAAASRAYDELAGTASPQIDGLPIEQRPLAAAGIRLVKQIPALARFQFGWLGRAAAFDLRGELRAQQLVFIALRAPVYGFGFFFPK